MRALVCACMRVCVRVCVCVCVRARARPSTFACIVLGKSGVPIHYGWSMAGKRKKQRLMLSSEHCDYVMFYTVIRDSQPVVNAIL